MNIKKILSLFMALCLLICFAGCGEKEDNADSNDNSANITKSYNISDVDFSNMPEIDAPMVRVYPGDGTLLFEYIVPGMDSNEVSLVNYSLTDNKMLGHIDLGSGRFSIQAGKNGEFSVCDPDAAEGRLYSRDCKEKNTVSVSCIDGQIGFILLDADSGKMLVSELSSGNLYIVTSDGTNKTKVDLEQGYYETIGNADGRFVVMHNAQEVFVIEKDGSAVQIFSQGSVRIANSDYAAGRLGDYLTFLPLQEGNWLFSKVYNVEESLLAAGKNVFLTLTENNSKSDLRVYRMSKLTVAESSVEGSVMAAAFTNSGDLAIVIRNADGFSYKLIDHSGWDEKAISIASDISEVIAPTPLPEIGSSDEVDSFSKEVLSRYNIRFVYENCDLINELAESGIEGEICLDRKRVLKVEKQLVKSLDFLPDKVWRNIGGSLPLAVFLCEKLPGNLAGISFNFGGYSCIFVEISGNDSVYTDTFIHEAGHSISRLVYSKNPELISEWESITPKEVRNAVEKGTADGKNALTTEYTPDDKSGNVCYVSTYAMKNPEEDRAETLAKFYSSVYKNGNTDLFSHKVLKEKAVHWEKMIRQVFKIDDDTKLPFDAVN